jgi:uncharacterized protein
MDRNLGSGAVIALLVLAFLGYGEWHNWKMIERMKNSGRNVYETTPPLIAADLKRPAILVFSKTNAFRHVEAIPAANTMFNELAQKKGWGFFATENGATFAPEILSRFDAVVFNNVTGDVLTPEQRAAFKSFLEQGGGFVGVHGAGGELAYDWHWYVEDVIGAQFIGHPIAPQVQRATVRLDQRTDPISSALPAQWQRTDEWYSFDKTVRKPGYTVLATLDESTYPSKEMYGRDIAMGKDHPIAWWHCIGRGRVFYSAMGHLAESYAEPVYRQMLSSALSWASRQAGNGCEA